ncbi:MAG: AAA family ATPase [Deltaproteobacteria bacterium]|nr:AAA family ATPase [Deltaproteobacteria bacterium]
MNSEKGPKSFSGRKYEISLLEEEHQKTLSRASFIVLYGRRRVGKTRLITEFYKDKNLWRFDGIEGQPKTAQIQNILDQTALYSGDDFYKSLKCRTWIELLKALDRAVSLSKSKYNKTIFLDELPYMAGRQSELVSAIKWAWDNLWQDKKGFTLVLCGSIASYMIKKVVKSSSLYGRIKLEILLNPLSVPEVSEFFGGKKALKEICDLYMFCGGIPEYLLQMDFHVSVSKNIARHALCKDGYFVGEFDRIFKDIFKEEKIYKKIILLLSRYKSLKIPEMTDLLGRTGGGGFVGFLENLESAGFIKSVAPFDRPEDSKLKRYRLDDEYLLFYFKFIYPNLKKIRENTDLNRALSLLTGHSYKSWAGFAFERLCLKHAGQLMKHLKMDQLVKNYGAYFDRRSNIKEGVQIDLLFERHDPVVTVCEMKYYDGLVGKWIIEDVEKKISLLGETKKTVEKVLVTTNGITEDLKLSNYFSHVVLIDELFASNHWPL